MMRAERVPWRALMLVSQLRDAYLKAIEAIANKAGVSVVKFLEKLRQGDPSSAVAYHLEGLLEAQDSIRSLLDKLGNGTASDLEGWAETLTYLQVEIYTHLAYHMKELRRPLKRLVDTAYRDLPDRGEDEEAEMATSVAKVDAT